MPIAMPLQEEIGVIQVEADQDLVRRTAEGDEHAYARLVQVYLPPVYRFLRRLLNSSEDAEDLAQETFLELYKHRLELRRDAHVLPYLFTIARRKAISLMRWRKVRRFLRPISSYQEEDLTKVEHTPRDHTHDKGMEEHLNRALGQLKPEKRSVLILRFFEGLSYQEIAEVMQKPENTVKSIAFRAEQELRAKLDPVAEGWGR